MLRSARLAFVSVFLFAIPLVSQPAFPVTQEFAHTYPLKANGSLELNNVNGTVRVEGWDKDYVEVHAVKTTPGKEIVLDRVAIDVDSRPGALCITTRYPQEEGVEVAVDYIIHVPRRVQLTHINTVNGALRLSDLESVGELHTVNGSIEVYESSGNVHAHTTNGNVYLELRRPADTHGALAETTNGSVLLAIPADMHADLEARCMNGSFSTDLPVTMQGAAQPRVLRGKIGQGGTAIRLGTVNGTIRVTALKSTV